MDDLNGGAKRDVAGSITPPNDGSTRPVVEACNVGQHKRGRVGAILS